MRDWTVLLIVAGIAVCVLGLAASIYDHATCIAWGPPHEYKSWIQVGDVWIPQTSETRDCVRHRGDP